LLQPPSLATVPKPDGTFEVKGIREGEYRVVAPTIFPGFYIKAIRYGADDVLSRPFKFSGTASGTFEVIFRSGAAQVSGTVRDAESKSVTGTQIVLIPTERSRLDLYRTTVTDPNGKFSMSNLTPGDYKLFSWETADMGAQYDPDFLKQYEDQGQSVRIVESSNQNIDVKLIPGQ
jgi:hypothetical protein